MAEVVVGDVQNTNLPKVDLPEFTSQPLVIDIPVPEVDDVSEQYLTARKDANAPSSAAWKGAIRAGMDPGEVVMGRPIYDAIETRTDGQQTFKVGVDNDDPNKSVVLSVDEFVDVFAHPETEQGGVELGDIGAGILKGAVRGLQDAGQEMGDFITGGFWSSTISPWMRENIPFLEEGGAALEAVIKPEGAVQETTAAFAAPMTQVIAPGALFTRAFRVYGYGRILAETLGYSVGEVVAMKPEEVTLMELGLQLIDDDPDIQSAIEKAFAAQGAESDFMARIKNMPRRVIEGGGIGILTERMFQAVGWTYRFMKNSPAYKNAVAQAEAGPLPSQVDMRIRQGAFENDIRSGKIGLDTPDIDVNEVRAIQANQAQEAGITLTDMSTVKMPRKALAPTAQEAHVISVVSETPEQAQLAVDTIARVRAAYPVGTGKNKFTPFEIVGGVFKDGKFVPKIREQAYGFHSGADKKKLANRMVSDVEKIVIRAQAGDKAAIKILSEARWYRDMRVRLRTEFGGLGDIFADLLGTTSAKTGVKQNWLNSIEILRRFTRGEYDIEIAAWLKREAAGESMNPITLQQLHKAGEFPLLTNAAGVLFNSNSPAAMKAIFGVFRDIKVGRSPKTPNFSGNLIGYSNDATIDVWAGRYLRNIAGKPYIPPPAEKAVGGGHLTGSTFDDPKIGGEFGFGQDVFDDAAGKLNKRGNVSGYDPTIGDMGADDLQAVVWFMEKEKWTKNGWTTKAGEGGSLDYEAALAGVADQGKVEKLRGVATDKFKAPKQHKAETDADYALRVQDLQSAHIARSVNADIALNEIAAPLDRTVLGVSAARTGKVPSNYEQAEMAAGFDDVLRGDKQVVAYKLTNTHGRFAGESERALDAEIVTRQGFDPAPLKKRLVETAIEKDQDAVFISKVVNNPTPDQNVNPGLEIYFTKRQQAEFAEELAERLREKGVDGFTFITDARHADRVNVQARAQDGSDTAGLTGLRVQYIPEFHRAPTPAIRQKMEDIFLDLVEEYGKKGDISSANRIYYETEVFRHGDKARTGWMSGGQTYDEFTGTAVK